MIDGFFILLFKCFTFCLYNSDYLFTLGRVRKIYQDFPQISVPQNLLGDDDDMQKLAEALGAAKTRVEGCSSFLKAAIR